MFFEIEDRINGDVLTIRTQDIKILKKSKIYYLNSEPTEIYLIEFYNTDKLISISKDDYERLNDLLLSCYETFKVNLEYLSNLSKEDII